MIAFLAWYGEQGSRVEEGERMAELAPAPELEGHDLEAWNFYCQSATSFVQEFGLMPALFTRAAGRGVARDYFLEKLGLIHAKALEIRARRAEAAATASARSAAGSGDVLIAADPT